VRIAMIDPAAYSLPYDTALCRALAAEGHAVTLFTTRFAHGQMPEPEGFELVEWFYRRKLPGPRRATRGLQHSSDLKSLARHLVEQRFDVVHVQWSIVDRIDTRVWQQLPVPVVFTSHNAVTRGGGEGMSCEHLRRFDAVVSHTAFGMRQLERCDLPRLWRIDHGALDHYVALAPPQPPPVELDADAPVVSLVGLLRPYKGVDLLLDAWSHVHAKVPEAQLVIAGRPMGVELPTHTPAGVHIVPRFVTDSEFAWLLRRSNVTCLPYSAIDLSGVLFAALALGTPLVLSDAGGFEEFEGAGARLFPRGSRGELARTLVELLQDPVARARLGAEAREAAEGRYSWGRIASEYTRRYEQLLARKRA
jgi:glycosyltransferase involved in cell wall biosynthesis